MHDSPLGDRDFGNWVSSTVSSVQLGQKNLPSCYETTIVSSNLNNHSLNCRHGNSSSVNHNKLGDFFTNDSHSQPSCHLGISASENRLSSSSLLSQNSPAPSLLSQKETCPGTCPLENHFENRPVSSLESKQKESCLGTCPMKCSIFSQLSSLHGNSLGAGPQEKYVENDQGPGSFSESTESKLDSKFQGFTNDPEDLTQKFGGNGKSVSASFINDKLSETQTQDEQISQNPNLIIQRSLNHTCSVGIEPNAPLLESRASEKDLLHNLQSGELSPGNESLGQKCSVNKPVSISMQIESSPLEGKEIWQISSSRTLGKSYPNLLASDTNQPKDISKKRDNSKDGSLETEYTNSSTMKQNLSRHNSLTSDNISLSATEKVPDGTSEADTLDSTDNQDIGGLSYAINGSCYYVNGKIESYRGKFLIDTGSSVSVVATKALAYLNSDIHIQPAERKVRTANGGLLDVKGKCCLEIQLDHLTFKQDFIIADIEESLGILGVNFLDENGADVKIRKRLLKTKLGKIKLHKRGAQVCSKLQLCENVTIPAQSETFVKAYMPENSKSQFNLVEPTNRYVDRGLLIARTLIDSSDDQMTISVLNVSKKNVKLKESTTLGIAHPVDQVSICSNNTDCQTASENEVESDHKECPEFLEPLVQNLSSDLSFAEKQKVSQLLGQFQDVFMSLEGKLGQTGLAEHYIDTGDHKPFKLPCHRIPLFQRPIIEKEISKMLEQNVIEPSASPWNSPICFVSKKQTGEWRFCVDLRALNSITKLDTYPLPRIDETLERLSNSEYFSTLDMASGYWQISLNKADRQKTSFSIPGLGSYNFKVMCFGLKNAPSSFSRLMEIVLRNLQYEKCQVYLDDIIVMGKDFETALENLKSVFLRLRQANLQLKVNKCKLFQKKVVFLGHLVSQEGITCDPEKLQVIKCWPQPKDKTEIRSFLGLVGYYRKMVPAFSEIALPLTRLTRKKANFTWGSDQQTAFLKLKECLMTPPILGFPLESAGPFLLDTDASGFAVGGILSQYQNNEERVIAYGSHTLNSAQQNYCATKRELYSVVYFLQHYKQYLLGRKFILRTDHAPLIWLCNFREPFGILALWLSILGAYDYQVVYRPGRLHLNADTLSRKPKRPCPFLECSECKNAFQKNPKSPIISGKVSVDQVFANAAERSVDESELVSSWLCFWTTGFTTVTESGYKHS